jgi:hypothetical protein
LPGRPGVFLLHGHQLTLLCVLFTDRRVKTSTAVYDYVLTKIVQTVMTAYSNRTHPSSFSIDIIFYISTQNTTYAYVELKGLYHQIRFGPQVVFLIAGL